MVPEAQARSPETGRENDLRKAVLPHQGKRKQERRDLRLPLYRLSRMPKSSKSRSDPQDGESDHGGRREISAIPRHRRRRAGSDRYTYRERGHKAPARRARMGGGSVWTVVQIQRPAISDLRKRRPRWVLVLPQPRSRPTEKPAENVPRPVGAASQMGY